MSGPVGIFWIRLVALIVVAGVIAAWRFAFQPGPALWSGFAGIGGGAASTALSYLILERSLRASNLKFLRAFFLGILIRTGVLAAAGLLIWGSDGYSLRFFLLALGLSYPFFLALEGWQLSRELTGIGKKVAAKASSSEG